MIVGPTRRKNRERENFATTMRTVRWTLGTRED
jgi:hypothetical protein